MLKKKSISPLIATILIIVLCTALIALVFSWEKDFANKSLSESSVIDISNKNEDFEGFIKTTSVYEDKFGSGTTIILTNGNSRKDLNIIGYQIIDNDPVINEATEYVFLEEPLIINSNGGSGSLNILCIPSNSFIVSLHTSEDNFVDVFVSFENSSFKSCDYVPVCDNNICYGETDISCPQDCNLSFELVDSILNLNYANSIDIFNNYVISGWNNAIGLFYLDSGSFLELDVLASSENIMQTEIDENYVYVLYEDSGLYIYTIDNNSLEYITHDNFSENGFNSLLVTNDYIYLGGSDLYALTFDGTTITEVEKETYYYGTHLNIYKEENYIFTANGSSGVHVFTFDGSEFTLVSEIDETSGGAYAIDGDGIYLYVANYSDGIRVYSFNGTSFSRVYHYTENTFIKEIYYEGGYVYFGKSSCGLLKNTFDGISFNLVTSISSGNFSDIFVSGNYLFSAEQVDGIKVYSNILDNVILLDNYESSGMYYSLEYSEPYVFVGGDNLFKIYTFEEESLSEIKDYSSSSDVYDVFLEDSNLFVSFSGQNSRMYEFEDGNLGEDYLFSSSGYDVSIKDNYFYSAAGYSGIKVYDLGSSNFNYIYGRDDGGTANEIDFLEEYVILANDSAGIFAYSFDGSELSLLGSVDDGYAEGIFVYDDKIFTSNGSSGFDVYTFDGSNFTNVFTNGIIDSDDVFVDDSNHVYVAAEDEGVYIYSYIDSELVENTVLNTNGYCYRVFQSREYLFVLNKYSINIYRINYIDA